jgi:hypothetical protein
MVIYFIRHCHVLLILFSVNCDSVTLRDTHRGLWYHQFVFKSVVVTYIILSFSYAPT